MRNLVRQIKAALIQPGRCRQAGLIGAIVGLGSLPLWAQSLQLPSPDTAIQQADQLPPEKLSEQLTQLEIDAETRDRLRFDPAWQPIVKAVRLDLMQLKWGNSQLENPVWQRYGAKAYPLLDYYARSADPTRRAYGMLGLRSLGSPYTTRWLERQLQRHSLSSFDVVTTSTDSLLAPETAGFEQDDWQQAFGLDQPQIRDRLVQIAQANLDPPTSPTYYRQFNLEFLIAVLGYEAVLPSQPSSFDPQSVPSTPAWDRYQQLGTPTPAQVQQAIADYRQQPRPTQDYILVQRLGAVKAGEISAAERQFLQALAASDSTDQIWALAELDRHGDPQASAQLETILNGNLEQLYPLTRLVSYADGLYLRLDQATHAYYLLLGMVQKYPKSRLVEAARAYGNLRGASYFGGEPRSAELLRQIAQRTPLQTTTAWQGWLNQYADHPGADDATYFIARGWQDQNQILAAFDLWVQLMTQSVGDGDATYLAWGHVRSLLDVGLSLEQLEKLPQLYRSAPLAPLFRYALAVRYARQQNYAKALQVSNGLDLRQMPEQALSSYYNPRIWGGDAAPGWNDAKNNAQAVQQTLQTWLNEQRPRWQKLLQLQTENTPQARYQIAADWAAEGGWKNGYLALWDDQRTYHLPAEAQYFCQVYWVCNTALRGTEAVQSSYQQASQNAIVLKLYQQLLADAQTPEALREKSLFMSASTLLSQWEDYPYGETLRMHPLPGMAGAPIAVDSDNFEAQQAADAEMQRDYIAALDQILAQLQQEFPDSVYTDDLLFSRYSLSGNSADLQQIVQRYPNGDRAEEARFLLLHAKPR